MAQLSYEARVLTDAGEETVKGLFSLAAGANHVRAGLPAGTVVSVTAYMPMPADADEKIFLNGYQSWTYCPEYSASDRIRGLKGTPGFGIRMFKLDRYADYHFVDYPNKKGLLHGFSYGYLRKGGRFRLFASLDEEPGYTQFLYDANAHVLHLTRDCAGLKVAGEYPLFDLFFAEGTEAEVFDAWFAAMGITARTKEPMKGYSSWYNRYENITEKDIEGDLAGCRPMLDPGDMFQVDDGWEPHVGDWLEPDPVKFPGGMKQIADRIHETGLRAGLWLAPFACTETSALYKDHPDWVIRDNGSPWHAGSNWGGFFGLDIDKPEVVDYVRASFRKVFDEWGFDLVKLDFLYAAAPFGNGRETRAGRMIRAMKLLRECCGEKLILGCGVPLWPAFGLVDYCRIGCDVGLDWDDKPWMRIIHRERVSTRHSLTNTIVRRQLNGRAFGNDPDVFFLRKDNIKLSQEKKMQLAKAAALLGSVLFISDDMGGYDEEQRRLYRIIAHLRGAENVRVLAEAKDRFRIDYRIDGREESLTVEVGK